MAVHGRRGMLCVIMRLLIPLFLTASTFATESLVSDVAGFDRAAAAAKAGDVIVLKNGEWKDARLKIRASGSEESPVTVRAQTAGKTLLTGDSRLQVGGRFVLVEGLHFQNPTSEEAIELRIDSDEVAQECRITQCAVVSTQPSAENGKKTHFISLYGREHRVDHCRFAGKTSEGPMMVVWLSEEHQEWGRHRIDHNHFGPREPLGRNGGETIRLGDSKTSLLNAECLVEHNLFEKCDGEAECISNKSCGNTYRRNTFLEVSGTLTLRHGNRCLVEKNAFLGNEAKGTGGVRIIGEGHVVRGNYFEKLTGDRERSPLCLMAGIPDTPLNGYAQVKDARIDDNLFIGCEHSVAFSYAGHKNATLKPLNTQVSGNYFTTAKPDDLDEHPYMYWEQKDLKKPAWVDQREPAGPTWE